ncbi:pleckstrin homology domain-containing family M member 2-like isoform X1 [Brienomyrus brachyistius]|uniref:pleckstrin homology domain-containing family M member 2-like isoform X1 n=1 Tax=Brienomyrus brachyistius TaxID=42636 RepID=UPI0020B3E281|nr:pleckstrin homology domain-containing family M member 2-like isoform X1 [Brienomyrus brachyistius]
MKALEAPCTGIRREIEPTPGGIAIATPVEELRTGVRLEARRPGRSRAVMDPFKVKDGILENISLSVKKLQSYFAACEDEAPAIRNHDRVLQRLCEHLDHALLYGLQDISLGYWVLVVHFTRKEAVQQIEELQNIATNLGRSRAWLYLALSESSLESYLRLFQENQALLHKYYFKNALVCSHDHLTLFLTLVSGLEFIRFDLELDAPYLDVAAYMPDYYKPQNLLDFEERLPGTDSLSLHSFNSTNLEWEDSAIAPSTDDEEVVDPVLCPSSVASDPQGIVAAAAELRVEELKVPEGPTPPSPAVRRKPLDEDSDANPSADDSPIRRADRRDSTNGDDTESTGTELEVIRMARRKKPWKRRRGKGAPEAGDRESSTSLLDRVPSPAVSEPSPEGHPARVGTALPPRPRCPEAKAVRTRGDDEEEEGMLRLPEMTDTSMDSVGLPLKEVMDKLNGALDGQAWDPDAAEGGARGSSIEPQPPEQQPFRGDPEGKPPDPAGRSPLSPQSCALASDTNLLQTPRSPADLFVFASHSPDPAPQGGGYHDPAGYGQQKAFFGGHEGEGQGEAPTGPDTRSPLAGHEDVGTTEVPTVDGSLEGEEEAERAFSAGSTHPAEFRVDNNHLLLLMIHVFREAEEQLVKMMRMSTGHMEGDLQPLYLLLTDCCIYLLRKGASEKPYMVEDAISYSELDYISVGVDQQTVTLVCINRRKQFLLDTADVSLTTWFLDVLKSAMGKGLRQPPYPAILTDATREKLSLAKFVSQECNCEPSNACILLYSLIHWEDPLDANAEVHAAPGGPSKSSSTKEGHLLYRAGTTYMGKELWKSCYLLFSNGILYQYPDRTDVTPMLSVAVGGAQCMGCRRSNSTERPHTFQVILTERPPLELSADSEQDMTDWMRVLCQSVSEGVIPPGMTPTPCIPCCLVLTDRKLLTCHQDCQTGFFRLLGEADLGDITNISLERDKEYCIIEFAENSTQLQPPWVLYFSSCKERDRLQGALESTWQELFQVCLPQRCVADPSLQKRCGEALMLIRSTWQRSDSLHRGRAQREPWC